MQQTFSNNIIFEVTLKSWQFRKSMPLLIFKKKVINQLFEGFTFKIPQKVAKQ